MHNMVCQRRLVSSSWHCIRKLEASLGTNSHASKAYLRQISFPRNRQQQRLFSSDMAAEVAYSEDHQDETSKNKHCNTCTCNKQPQTAIPQSDDEPLPPPLPTPTYSVYKRVLPPSLIALSSTRGRRFLMESLQQGTAESYWSLSEHFINQSDPAFCGVTTLVMVLNSMSVDPNVRWRGGWRYFGNENVLLSKCCISSERVKRVGITVTEFALLAKCQGVHVTLKQPDSTTNSVGEFRNDILQILQTKENNIGILVVSFARSSLGQTGEGHFSPIAAYHAASDSVLILDVARFKYAPYWVTVSDLYRAMEPLDPATDKPRGWFLMVPPEKNAYATVTEEHRRPVEIVPESGEADICPIGKFKVEYCSARRREQVNAEKVSNLQ